MLSVSRGNTKMGDIPSLSLPAGKTCLSGIPCYGKCYGRRIEAWHKNVNASYERNLKLLVENPQLFWMEVEISVASSRFFRFHVSGDIPNSDYLEHMINLMIKYPHCEALCFTKKYDIVNRWLDKNGKDKLPKNLHILFSVWEGLECPNPYSLPEAHVKFRDGRTTASASAYKCNGNCTYCAINKTGCWNLQEGEQVVFDEH